MDAACNADWDAPLRIAAHVKYDFALGRLANATRLCSSSDSKNASTLESSAYSALHQAACISKSTKNLLPFGDFSALFHLPKSLQVTTSHMKNLYLHVQKPLGVFSEKFDHYIL
jgi:hypothetical protein